MSALPTRFAATIVAFAPLFRQRTWRHARALLIGAILKASGLRWLSVMLLVPSGITAGSAVMRRVNLSRTARRNPFRAGAPSS